MTSIGAALRFAMGPFPVLTAAAFFLAREVRDYPADRFLAYLLLAGASGVLVGASAFAVVLLLGARAVGRTAAIASGSVFPVAAASALWSVLPYHLASPPWSFAIICAIWTTISALMGAIEGCAILLAASGRRTSGCSGRRAMRG